MKGLILTVLIIVLGLFLRVYNLDRLAGFDYDQEVAANWIKELIVNHKFSTIGQETSVSGVFMAPFFYYLLTPIFVMFNYNPLALNYFLVFCSVLTMIYLYKWSKSRIALFLYTIHPGIINFDQTVAPSNLVMLIASAVGFYLVKKNKKTIDYVILGIFLGLTFSAHPPSTLLIPLTFIIFVSRKEAMKNYILMAVPIIIFVLPLVIFYWRHGLIFPEFPVYYSIFPRLILNIKLLLVYCAGILISSDFAAIKYLLMFLVVLAVFKIKDLIFRLWIILPLIFISFISKNSPEYYFQLLTPAILVYFIKYFGRYLPIIIMVLSAIVSFIKLTSRVNLTGFYYKNEAVKYISPNSPVTIYYSNDLGQNWGFNYLFWKNNIIVSNTSPDKYLIITPSSREPQTQGTLFGDIKVSKIE